MAGLFEAFVGQDTGGYPSNPPLTQTASAHAVTIKTNRGIKIGRIQSWSPNMSRTVDTLYEVSALNKGEPIERVPQVQTTNSITISRYELYTFFMGEAFNAPIRDDKGPSQTDLVSLTDQNRPFYVREIWRDPFGTSRVYAYMGCWFSSIGVTIAANDDRIVKSNATLEFTRRVRIL